MRGSHIKLGEGERKVRLGQDSLPNKAEMSRDYIRCFTHTHYMLLQYPKVYHFGKPLLSSFFT